MCHRKCGPSSWRRWAAESLLNSKAGLGLRDAHASYWFRLRQFSQTQRFTCPHGGFSAVSLPTHAAWEVSLQFAPASLAFLNLKALAINDKRGEIPVLSPPDHFHKDWAFIFIPYSLPQDTGSKPGFPRGRKQCEWKQCCGQAPESAGTAGPGSGRPIFPFFNSSPNSMLLNKIFEFLGFCVGQTKISGADLTCSFQPLILALSSFLTKLQNL